MIIDHIAALGRWWLMASIPLGGHRRGNSNQQHDNSRYVQQSPGGRCADSGCPNPIRRLGLQIRCQRGRLQFQVRDEANDVDCDHVIRPPRARSVQKRSAIRSSRPRPAPQKVEATVTLFAFAICFFGTSRKQHKARGGRTIIGQISLFKLNQTRQKTLISTGDDRKMASSGQTALEGQ